MPSPSGVVAVGDGCVRALPPIGLQPACWVHIFPEGACLLPHPVASVPRPTALVPSFLDCPVCGVCTAGEFDSATMHASDDACRRNRLQPLLQHRLGDAGAQHWLRTVLREMLGAAVTEELLGPEDYRRGQMWTDGGTWCLRLAVSVSSVCELLRRRRSWLQARRLCLVSAPSVGALSQAWLRCVLPAPAAYAPSTLPQYGEDVKHRSTCARTPIPEGVTLDGIHLQTWGALAEGEELLVHAAFHLPSFRQSRVIVVSGVHN